VDFIRSNLLKDHTAATEVITKDLPINPLSHILVNLSVYNATDEATLAEIVAFVNKVEVLKEGASIISLESEDLHALNVALYGAAPVLTQNVATDNATRELTLVVPMGRTIMNPNECYPATKKGELTLKVDTTVPATSCDNGVLNIETVELPGASPTQHLKAVLKSVTAPGATGDNDVELPIGNRIVGLILYTTTVPATSSHTYGIQEARILRNNKEWGYASAKANCIKGDGIFLFQSLPRTIAAFGSIVPANYLYMPFSPHFGDDFALDSAGLSSLKLRLNMGVDEAAKVIPLEIVSTAGGA
jgi:hypothetical protein